MWLVVDATHHRIGCVSMIAAATTGMVVVAGIALAPRVLDVRREVAPGAHRVTGRLGVLRRVNSRRPWSRARNRRTIESAMPSAVELLVVSLHAGRSPSQAMVELARIAPEPVRPAFQSVEHRLHRGHSLGDALHELTTQCGPCALALVTSVGAAVRDGLPLTPVLDRLTDDVHSTRRRQGEAAARRLPVRLSFPLVVCTLPSFVLLSIVPAVLGALSTLQGSAL